MENKETEKSEREIYLEAFETAQMADSAPFKRFMDFMRGLVEEAHEDMLGNISGNDSVTANLTRRWQQRIAMVRAAESYFDSAKKTVELQVEQMRCELEEAAQ